MKKSTKALLLFCALIFLFAVIASICGLVYILIKKSSEDEGEKNTETTIEEKQEEEITENLGRIYYVQGTDIVSKDINGNDLRTVVKDVEQDVSYIQLSPDGKYLLYRVDKDLASSLYLVDLQNDKKIGIDSTERMNSGDTLGGILLADYPFSPDSLRFSYSKNNQIWVSNVAGEADKQYDLPLTMSTVMVYNPMPQWLDNETLVFIRKGEEMVENGFSGIALSSFNILGRASIPDIVKISFGTDETDIRAFWLNEERTKILYNGGVADGASATENFYMVDVDGQDKKMILSATEKLVKSFDKSFTYYIQKENTGFMVVELTTKKNMLSEPVEAFADWAGDMRIIILEEQTIVFVDLASLMQITIGQGKLPAAYGLGIQE